MTHKKGDGNLPLLVARGESISEAWENSVVELYEKGVWYVRQGPKDGGKVQVDSTMVTEITNPDSNLFYHKSMTCQPGDLLEYEMEIMGAKDSWVAMRNPEGTEWPYHYHESLATHPTPNGLVDQIEGMIKGLCGEPWKRRNQAVTWVVERDLGAVDPPCLQRIWASIIPNETEPEQNKLNFNYHFRSRNVMIAGPINMVGLYALMDYIKNQVKEIT